MKNYLRNINIKLVARKYDVISTIASWESRVGGLIQA